MRVARKCISQPQDWWEAFNKAAESDGKTLAGWMGEICRQQLSKRVQGSLSDRPAAHRPKKDASNE